MMGIGFPELMVILIIIMIIFGAGKLPEIGSAFGRSIKNFKTSMKEAQEGEETAEETTEVEEGEQAAQVEEGKAEDLLTEEEKEAAIRKKAEEDGKAKDKAMRDKADSFTASLPRKGSYDFNKDQEESKKV